MIEKAIGRLVNGGSRDQLRAGRPRPRDLPLPPFHLWWIKDAMQASSGCKDIGEFDYKGMLIIVYKINYFAQTNIIKEIQALRFST